MFNPSGSGNQRDHLRQVKAEIGNPEKTSSSFLQEDV